MASPGSGSGSGSGIPSKSKVAATQPETNQEPVGISKTSQTSQERLPKTKSAIEPNTPEKFQATANPGKEFVSEQSTASYTGAPKASLKKPSHNLSVASNASELPKEQHAASISTPEQNNQGPLHDLSAVTEDVKSSRETGARSRPTPSSKNVSLDLPLNSDACKASNEPRSSASSASKRSNNGPSSSPSAISTNRQASKDLPSTSSTLRPNSKQSFRHHVASKQIRASTSSSPQASLKGKMPAQNPVSVASQDINYTAASSSRPSITEPSSVSTSTSTTSPNRNLATNQPQPVAQMEVKRALHAVTVTAGHDDEEKRPSVCQQIVDFFLCRPCCRGQGCCGKNGCIAACDCKGCCCSCC